MKIFHLCETLKGGIATHLNNLARLQLKAYRDAEIFVLCPAHHVEYVDAPGVTVVPFTHGGRGPIAIARLWREWAALIREHEPDLVHLHSTFAGVIGRTIPHSARIVYCAHGWSFTTNASPLKKRIYRTVERFLSRRSDAIIVISRAEHEAAIAAGIDARKCTVVYNGIEDRSKLAAIRSSGDTISALFVGRLDEQKGYDVLVDAFRLLGDKDIRLDIVGEAVQGHATMPDLPGNVTTHGWMPHDQLGAIIAACDVLIVPSRWEGFGMVAIEAMREGKPVVAHNVGGLPEIVADRETGLLFSPLNATTLADVLGGLGKPQLRQMGTLARQRFESHFTDRAMYGATDEIYRRILPARLFGAADRPTALLEASLPAARAHRV